MSRFNFPPMQFDASAENDTDYSVEPSLKFITFDNMFGFINQFCFAMMTTIPQEANIDYSYVRIVIDFVNTEDFVKVFDGDVFDIEDDFRIAFALHCMEHLQFNTVDHMIGILENIEINLI